MRKNYSKIVVLLLVLLLCLPAVSCIPSTTSPETLELNGFTIAIIEPEIEFPDSITFDIELDNDAEISKITLHYRVDRLSPIPVISEVFPEFEPDTAVSTSWTWDLSDSGGLPPGTRLEYWWSIEDAQGDSVETEPAEISFDDERHSWKSTSSGQIILFWYDGSDSFADSLMSAAQEALDRLTEDTGAGLEGEAKIYIYASAQDLRDALVYPQEWTGGVAFTEFGTVAIGISTGSLDWGKGAIAHELTHLAVHQFIFNGYGVTLPTWLDEGLAQHAEGDLRSSFQSRLEQAIEDDELFSVSSLCGSFPAQTEGASLAYAQSYSLVEYLLEERGSQVKMHELLNAFKEGNDYTESLDEVYGLDLEQLDTLWREYVGGNGS